MASGGKDYTLLEQKYVWLSARARSLTNKQVDTMYLCAESTDWRGWFTGGYPCTFNVLYVDQSGLNES
jgi:hypothetical protein